MRWWISTAPSRAATAPAKLEAYLQETPQGGTADRSTDRARRFGTQFSEVFSCRSRSTVIRSPRTRRKCSSRCTKTTPRSSSAASGRIHRSMSAEWLRRWPLRKFPLLVDGERNVAETSIIIEYLQLAHPGPVRLLPADPMAALEVRFLDRFFDLHVMDAMQHGRGRCVDGRSREARRRHWPSPGKGWSAPTRWLEEQLAGRTWAAGADFTLADCAAAPVIVLCGLDSPHFRGFSGAARLSRAAAGPSFLRPGGGRGAAVPAAVPARSARSRLTLHRLV